MNKGSKTKLAKKSLTKKKAALQKAGAHKRQVQRESQSVDTVAFAPEGQGARSGRAIGRFAGVIQCRRCGFRECGRVARRRKRVRGRRGEGREDAEDADGGEVRTHEVATFPPSIWIKSRE
jgi:hypothetical protein